MMRTSLLILMTLCGCASTPYNGKYRLNSDENADYSIEKRLCQIEATERAMENLNGGELGPAWLRIRRKIMLACMKEKGFEWDQK
jgi:hypothetical protein